MRKTVLMILGLSIIPVFQIRAQDISGMISQQVANQISRTVSDAISKQLADRFLYPTLKVKKESGQVRMMHLASDSKLLVLKHDDDSIRVWDLVSGVQRPVIRFKEDVNALVAISTRKLVAIGSDDGIISLVDTFSAQVQRHLKVDYGDITALGISADETYLAAAYTNGKVVIWDLNQYQKSNELDTDYGNDIKQLAFVNQNNELILAGEGGFIEKQSLNNHQVVQKINEDIEDITRLWVKDGQDGVIFEDEDGVLRTLTLPPKLLARDYTDRAKDIAINKDLSSLAIALEKKVVLWDIVNQAFFKEIGTRQNFVNLFFLNPGEKLLGVDDKGILHLINLTSGTEILQLISTETGWTIVDEQGRFDSSEPGMNNVAWEAEDFEIPIEDFAASHYEPGLLATHIEPEPEFINEKPVDVPKGIKLPPEVTLSIEDSKKTAGQPVRIKVEAQGLGGGVKQVNLYHNGKRVSTDALLDTRTEEQQKLIKKIMSFQVVASEGENTFKVIASNEMDIESQSETLTMTFEGQKPPSVLHIITVGINQYKDSRLNLDYSVADAMEIAGVFKTAVLKSYDQLKQIPLRDQEATRSNILTQLKQLKTLPQQDALVIYLAGHGLAVNGEWYYLPHETLLQDNETYYTQVGISASEIQKSLADTQIQKILVMIDACYSGAGLSAFRKLQDTQRHFSRAMSQSVGVVVMAATRKDQEAAELSDLGHGLFTYVVTDGMKGKADFKPQNQLVSAHEVAEFSTQTIPQFSRKYLGAAQEPTAFTMGRDFDLVSGSE